MKNDFTKRVAQIAIGGLLMLGLQPVVGPIVSAADTNQAKEPAKDSGQAKAAESKPADKKAAEEEKDYANWAEFMVGGSIINGNDAAFQQRHYMTEGAFGGLQDLHYERQLSKRDFLEFDARALFELQDFMVRLEAVRQDLGFLRGGYKSIRTWYNGTGGYDIPSNTTLSLANNELSVDRGEAWVETGLTLKNWPTITLKYTYQFRDGQKDSTIWGQWLPPGGINTRGIYPTLLDLDEDRHIIQGDVRHTLGKTTLGVGLRYEHNEVDGTRKTRQDPNTAPAGSDNTYLATREDNSSDLLHVHAFGENRFSEKVFLSSSLAYSTMDADLGGSRVFGNDYDVAYSPALARDTGFLGLGGNSDLREFLVNLNLMYRPWETFAIVPSVRYRDVGIDSWSAYTLTGAGALTSPVNASSERDYFLVDEQLEMRYSGITNWVLYARGEWTEGEGDLTETCAAAGAVPIPLAVDRYTEDSRLVQKYVAGANWYPLRNMNWDFQYYHKMRDIDYTHPIDNTLNSAASANRYPAYFMGQDYDTDDVNVRLTLRPVRNLTLVSRYDYQISTIETTPDPISGLGTVESGRILSQILSQNATWVPWSRLYLQGTFSYVWNKTETPVDQLGDAVVPARNNYWTLGLGAGFVLDQKTDLQANYYYYRADNYVDTGSFVPYGAGGYEHAVVASVTHRLKSNIRVGLRYGFYYYHDDLSGGFNNYTGNVVSATLAYRF